MRPILLPILICLVIFTACQTEPPASGGLSPAEALAGFQFADTTFTIELFAAEPLVQDPVAMEVDENGRLYVVEMPGYPSDLTKTGRVKLLSDTNGDGLPDKATVFANQLILPGGVMAWKNGIIVVDPPEVLYFEDTDGDGRADKREVLLTGLALSNPQHNANTPVFGPDGWIYIAHMGHITPKIAMEFDDEGGEIYFPARPDGPRLPKNANGRNIRFKPDTYELEMLSGETQYGQAFSPWGHHFGTENAHHLFHEVIAARYLNRNPHLLVPDATENIPDHGNACEVFPITQNPKHQLLTDVGVITSACGIAWCQGGLFPKEFDDVMFTCEPTHNLIHADRIRDKGATFTASRMYEKKEFLASTDPWFRPVFNYIGPDGALYVVDYYRPIIEHPEWMSEEVNKSGKLYEGTDRGRIWRVTADGGRMTANGGQVTADGGGWLNRVRLGEFDDEDLWRRLDLPNIWQRRTAQRLLTERGTDVGHFSKNLLPGFGNAGYVHALWLMESLGKTEEEILQKALAHAAPGVRENALKIAELHLADMPGLAPATLALANDPSPKVRYQALLTLGYLDSPQATAARMKILKKDIEDKWVQYAALSASPGSEVALYDAALREFAGQETPGRRQFFENCAAVTALSGNAAQMRRLTGLALKNPTPKTAWQQAATMEGLAKALEYKPVEDVFGETERNALAASFSEKTPAEVRRAAIRLTKSAGIPKWEVMAEVGGRAENFMRDKSAPLPLREDAVRLLAVYVGYKESPGWGFLLSPEEPVSLQKTVLEAMRQSDAINCTPVILEKWNSLSPEVRDEALSVFFDNDHTMTRLLDALEKGQIGQGSLAWPRQVRLMNHDDPAIRNRARALLASGQESRSEVLKRYQPSLAKPGDSALGAEVFKRACATCHQIGGQGGMAFGPDLGTVRNRQKTFLLADILDPNRSIADGYVLWFVERKSGGAVSGVIASETAASLTLKDQTGRETTIPRTDILKMEGSEISPMTAGLENTISVEEMADLLAFLKK
jgi:putative membrane-bound dehydrogenase-like protein